MFVNKPDKPTTKWHQIPIYSMLPSSLLCATLTQSSSSSIRIENSEFSFSSFNRFSLSSLSITLRIAFWINGSLSNSRILSTRQTPKSNPPDSRIRSRFSRGIKEPVMSSRDSSSESSSEFSFVIFPFESTSLEFSPAHISYSHQHPESVIPYEICSIEHYSI